MQAFAAGDRTAWGFAFAFGGRGYAPGAEGFRAALTPAHRALFDKTLAALRNVKADDSGTANTERIADKALAALGWSPQVSLSKGLAETYAWFAARRSTAGTVRG